MSDKYIDQVKKLLALSKSSNPHEAALALNRANKLMQKYKINLKELKPLSFTELSLRFSRGINNKKISSLVAYIIKNSAECYILGKSNPKELLFIGDYSSLLQAKYIFTFLDRSLAAAKKSYVKNQKEYLKIKLSAFLKINSPKIAEKIFNVHSKQQNNLKRQTDIYLIGYLQAICESLIITETVLPTNLLEFVNSKYPNLKTQQLRTIKINSNEQKAFKQGLKDGKKIKINKAVDGTDKNNYLSLD